MKKLLFCSIFLAFAHTIFGQAVSPEVPLTSEHYLKRSKHQKTTARVLLGIGATAVVGGALISVGNNDDLDGSLTTSFVGVPLIITGFLVAIISNPIFKASQKNAKLGLEVRSSMQIVNAISTDLVEVAISPEPDAKILLITSDKKHLIRSISVLDMKGILINQYMDIHNTSFQLPVHQLTVGQYTLIIQFDEGPIARQLIIR